MNTNGTTHKHAAYQHCLFCAAVMPRPTSGHLRRHYRGFHLITKEAAIDVLIWIAEEQAGIAPEKENSHEQR